MESMGNKPRRRRAFTAEFKAEIVELCQRGDRSIGQVARDFDLTDGPVADQTSRRLNAARQSRRKTSAHQDCHTIPHSLRIVPSATVMCWACGVRPPSRWRATSPSRSARRSVSVSTLYEMPSRASWRSW